MRKTIFGLVLLLWGAGGAFAQDTATPATPPAATDTTPGSAATAPAGGTVPASGTAAPAAPAAAPAPPSNPPMTGPRLLIQTAMGDITLQLDKVRAPKTVANVLRYVREGHYNGTVVYRVVKGFIIEMGSWDANVKGRPVHKGVKLEAGNGLSNLRGAVALAHGDDPNSGTADFFIDLADNTPLDKDPGFAVFGEVVSGMEVADAISSVPVGDHGPMPGAAPIDPILIKKVSILPPAP